MKIKKLILGKTILFSILVAFAIFVIIRIYHYQVLKKISDKTIEFMNAENYNLIVRDVGEESESIYEQYKNGKMMYTRRMYNAEEHSSDYNNIEVLEEEFLNSYYVDNKDSYLSISTYSEDNLNEYSGIFNFHSYTMHDTNDIYFESDLKSKISTWLQFKVMYPAVFTEEYNGKECYVLNEYSTIRLWVDKETLLPLKVEYKDRDKKVIHTTYYEYNLLQDNVVEIPNPKDFETVVYYDNGKQVEESWKKPAEEPISGTNLKSDEQLIENVEIKDGEELNFLNITPNENGITSLNIYSYDTYNKFRSKYSGLRELTEKDFERYFVSIAFKEGYKLEYIEHWESGQENITNFIVSSKKADKDNFTLFILPKSTGNMRTNYVINDKKISIDSYDAVEEIQKYLDDFAKQYNLTNMDFMGYRDDVLCRLSNEKFAELDYIKKPVKGEEPICWKIDYCVYRGDEDASFDYLNIYVDATTGELIGSKADY